MIQRFVVASVGVVPSSTGQRRWLVWDRETRRFLDVEPGGEVEAHEVAESLNYAAESDHPDGESFEAYLESLPVPAGQRRCRECHGAMHDRDSCPERGGSR